MTPADLLPLVQHARHNQSAGWGWAFVHPQQLLELIAELEDAQQRLASIAALATDGLGECERLERIRDLALYGHRQPNSR